MMGIEVSLDWVWEWSRKSLLCCKIVGHISLACSVSTSSTTSDFMTILVIFGVINVENVLEVCNSFQNPFSLKKVSLLFLISMTA